MLLAAIDQGRLRLVVSRADDAGVSAKDLLIQHLSAIDGRGGGDERTAQGGGAFDERQADTLFLKTAQLVARLIGLNDQELGSGG